MQCAHCGENCPDQRISLGEKFFCCTGCKLVYELLNENGLCDYYTLNNTPGQNQRIQVRKDKFAFLDDGKIKQELLQYSDETQAHVLFYIPHIHCSSCLWLLENLHRLDEGVQRVTVNFARKEAQIVFDPGLTSLRQIAETLTSIGYEPYISLQDLQHKKPRLHRDLIYRLGVAGFCFGNIMLLSFPEYFGGRDHDTAGFRYLNLALALPVFFYSAQVFFNSAWKGLKAGFLNIDLPIVLAITVTFIRSLVEIFYHNGAGYFDSMTGIVFFMLIGRVLQDKTYQGLSFDRDYTSYFPLAVTLIRDGKEIPAALPEIKVNDTLLIHNNELIPADGILIRGTAMVDYSFVTGESAPVYKQKGEIVYAGGKQLEGNIEILTIKEVAQSYLTSLWNRDELKRSAGRKGKISRNGHTDESERENLDEEKMPSFIHLLSRYFTWVVLAIAAVSAAYWWQNDTTRIWPAVTAVLIIACPCALLLSASFTNGHILRILSRHKLYLRNANVIERLARINHIVFDKTGTLTGKMNTEVRYHGAHIAYEQIGALAAQSGHPLSQAIARFCDVDSSNYKVQYFKAVPAQGISGKVDGHQIKLGSAAFTGANHSTAWIDKPLPEEKNFSANTDVLTPTRPKVSATGSLVFVNIDQQPVGYFTIGNSYRPGVPALLATLRKDYGLSLLSGDNNREATFLRELMGPDATLRFNQQPVDKLRYINELHAHTLMIGDGLNDAGALKQSDVGICLAENSNNFTPASDGILEASQLPLLPKFIRLCKANRRIIIITFIISILYNLIGLFYAVQGVLSPLTAAILMPASSISIVILTYVLSEISGTDLNQ
jgi:P-type Cu+ transporter